MRDTATNDYVGTRIRHLDELVAELTATQHQAADMLKEEIDQHKRTLAVLVRLHEHHSALQQQVTEMARLVQILFAAVSDLQQRQPNP
jgi:hypothetical protein